LLLALVLFSSASAATAQATQTLTTAAPEDVGLSSQVLARIGPTMQAAVDAGRTGGIVTLVARHGEIVHWDASGWRVLGEDALEPNDIFRIYSMTKPVTSVAAMMLVESGDIGLDDPVSMYVPSFADPQIFEADGSTRPARREVTLRDLLSHTSGLTYGIFGNTPADQLVTRNANPVAVYSGRSLEQVANALGEIPLLFDPGTKWNYSMSTDVLGRVIEVASGVTLEAFFHSRIFAPLGMEETGFSVDEADMDRLVAMYTPGDAGLKRGPEYATGARPSWFSGGGGLYSTAADYFRFAQMLGNGGELDGARLVSSETLAEMSRNHLPDDLIPIAPYWPDTGFGLGFAVAMTEHTGNFWWMGMANTYFWVDPNEDLVVFAWTQYDPPLAMPLDRLIRPIVYEAIIGN